MNETDTMVNSLKIYAQNMATNNVKSPTWQKNIRRAYDNDIIDTAVAQMPAYNFFSVNSHIKCIVMIKKIWACNVKNGTIESTIFIFSS